MLARGISVAERCFIQDCQEHNCKEVPGPMFFSTETKHFKLLNWSQWGGDIQLTACEKVPGVLTMIMHCDTLNLAGPIAPDVLQRISKANKSLRMCAVVVDSANSMKVTLVQSFSVIDSMREASGLNRLKKMIWESARIMANNWKVIFSSLQEALAIHKSQVSQLKPIAPYVSGSQEKNSLVPNSTQLYCADMKKILKTYLQKHSFNNLREAEKDGFHIVYFAVVNNGGTLSRESSTFPQIYLINERTLKLQIVFSRNESAFEVEKAHEPYFLQLIMHMNNRLKIGKFQYAMKEKHISFMCYFPYFMFTEDQVKQALEDMINTSIDRFKLASMTLSRLYHDLKELREGETLQRNIATYLSDSEELRPEYKDPHTSSVLSFPKCQKVRMRLNFEKNIADFDAEKQLFDSLMNIPDICQYLLHKAVHFDPQRKVITCFISDMRKPIDFCELFPDYSYKISSELNRMRLVLSLHDYHLTTDEWLYVVQKKDGSMACNLLPWKLKSTLTHEPTRRTVSKIVSQILSKWGDAKESRVNISYEIPFEEIQVKGTDKIYHHQVVNLHPLTETQSQIELMDITSSMVDAPMMIRLPCFAHIIGWVDDPNQGRCRVEMKLSPILSILPSMSTNMKCNMMHKIGQSLQSLHKVSCRNFCLTPSSIAYVHQQVYFLASLLDTNLLRLATYLYEDLWFLSPEVLRVLLDERSQDYEEVESYFSAPDVYSLARLAYFCLVDEQVQLQCHSGVPRRTEKRKATSQDVETLLSLYEEGVRPLIPHEFEKKFPKLTIFMRTAWENPYERPSIESICEALGQEGDLTLSFETYYLSAIHQPASM